MRRRSFLVGSVALLGCRPWLHPRTDRESPTEHQRITLAAMADMFLPGTPGANDVDAVSVITDPTFGVNPYISEVVADLDDWCNVRHGARDFIELDAETREIALEERMGLRGKLIASFYQPVYEGINALTKLAFFGGLTHVAGENWLAFPGASTGWAGGSAGGAYASGKAQTIDVDGAGNVSIVRVTVIASDGTRARITAPGGASVERRLPLENEEVALTGGVAAGTWKLSLDRGTLTWWSLRLRTDLDEAVS